MPSQNGFPSRAARVDVGLGDTAQQIGRPEKTDALDVAITIPLRTKTEIADQAKADLGVPLHDVEQRRLAFGKVALMREPLKYVIRTPARRRGGGQLGGDPLLFGVDRTRMQRPTPQTLGDLGERRGAGGTRSQASSSSRRPSIA